MFKRILVPLDGSALAEQILPQVQALARLHESEIFLLRAAEAHAFPGSDPTQAQVEVVQEAEEYLKGVQDRLQRGGVKKVNWAVWYGSPAEAITEYAKVHEVDLVAMLTHGRSGVSRWVLGSVAEKVLRGTSVPILLVRAPGALIQ